MKKIRILRIIARLNIGGPAIHTVLLTASLPPEKFSTVLAAGSLSAGEGDMSYYARNKGVQVTTIAPLTRQLDLFSDISACAAIYSLLAKGRFDIIHTHTAKAGTLGRLAAVVFNLFHPSCRVKIVHTFHGHVLSGYFNPVTTAVFTAIERTLALFTHRIVTVSVSVRDDLVRLKISRKEKILVIPLGFELDPFLGVGPRSQQSGFVVGIVGRLVPIKNHRMFLDAAALVHRKLPLIRFQVVGDGEERGNLEAYARTSAIDCVEFTGWSNDLTQVYSGLDVVVLTSINEGTPVSVIEAMACGRPVVATDVGGVRDLFGAVRKEISSSDGVFRLCERGILVPSNDSRSLASAVAFMHANAAARREMGTAGRAYVRDAFSKQRLVRDIEDLYEKLLGNDII